MISYLCGPRDDDAGQRYAKCRTRNTLPGNVCTQNDNECGLYIKRMLVPTRGWLLFTYAHEIAKLKKLCFCFVSYRQIVTCYKIRV